MRLSGDALVARARAAEASGFHGMAGMDHLAPPLAESQPMLSSMVTNTWLAAHTSTLVLSSLVLCDSFRHPAILAQEAASLDHLSHGRFELGIGWGSVVDEMVAFDIASPDAKARVARLRDSLVIIKALWSGESVDYQGEVFSLNRAQQGLVPLSKIPIVIGGFGPQTLKLVAEHADWWNVAVNGIDKLEEMRAHAGSARVSIQQMVGFVPSEAEREGVVTNTARRFGPMGGPKVGDAAELVDYFGSLGRQGIERVYTWFSDFARPETIEAFGEQVIAQLN
jgi:alkanesulfonate monooxygenase SsuD/methylene tetrahydromethanopterin reductase-like flavin-dependent oxidoreductase (luciferase family)